MEIANLVLEYVKVLIYPSLIGMAVVLFRKELSLLLSGKLTAKYKDLTIMLERQREELEASERKSKVAAATISSIKENNEEKDNSNTTIKEIISILELKPNEYSVVEFLASKESSLTTKAELIERFSDQRIPFFEFKSQLEDVIENLVKKGIIVMENGNYHFAHIIFKEILSRKN